MVQQRTLETYHSMARDPCLRMHHPAAVKALCPIINVDAQEVILLCK
jgi:hypothetical protein